MIALAATLALSGCASLRLDNAARAKGSTQAGVSLPAWPGECRRPVPHAPLVAGAEVLSVLKRERAALDRANSKSTDCGAFYDSLKRKLETMK